MSDNKNVAYGLEMPFWHTLRHSNAIGTLNGSAEPPLCLRGVCSSRLEYTFAKEGTHEFDKKFVMKLYFRIKIIQISRSPV
jgi:hypothetical protein